jgi:hypothetical protein
VIPTVTVIGLIFRSREYLSFLLDGIYRTKNETPFCSLIIGCDPEPQIEADFRVNAIYRNPNALASPGFRTYHAWNHGALIAETPYICFIGSDMYGYDHWLDELMKPILEKPKTIPTSFLIENGRIPSAFPETVRDHGNPTRGFNLAGFRAHAAEICKPGVHSKGRLNQPVIFNREDFLARGGFPTRDGGDVDFFRDMVVTDKYEWITCEGSVVYHTCRGEAQND